MKIVRSKKNVMGSVEDIIDGWVGKQDLRRLVQQQHVTAQRENDCMNLPSPAVSIPNSSIFLPVGLYIVQYPG